MTTPAQGIRSSMDALTTEFNALSHNLANSSTTGFKRVGTRFSSELNSRMGSVNSTNVVDFRQGPMTATGRPLDLALDGDGMFVLETPQGELYTRNGTFRINATGQLVDSEGRVVAGKDGPIVMPTTVSESQIEVAANGSLSANGRPLGRLKVVRFEDASILTPVGASAFARTRDVAPDEAPKTAVHQGFREASNVSPVEELVRLITITRMYQAQARSVQSNDDRMKDLLRVAMGT